MTLVKVLTTSLPLKKSQPIPIPVLKKQLTIKKEELRANNKAAEKRTTGG